MKPQNYANHIRWYIPHHFIFYPVILVGIIVSTVAIAKFPEQLYIWLAIMAIFFLIGVLSLMMRQHYALGNQDRIVRVEMRLRYFILTGQTLNEEKLSMGQISALRFAGDDELRMLTIRAIAEQLTPDQIKKAVKNWQADDMRR